MHSKQRLAAEGFKIASGANPKEKDRAFAESLGFPVPATLAAGLRLAELSPEPGTIIKPVRGSTSRGVFFVDGRGRLHSLRTQAVYPSLAAAMVEIDEVRSKISADDWMVEQAVLGPDGGPANDIKVHVFYGVVGTTLEVAHGAGPERKDLFCYYDEDLRPIDIGRKYIQLFEGTGVPAAALERAVEMSLASPTPFLRFDFYKGVDDVYLGEITPHPGASHAGHISPRYDRQLGELFLDAHARLTADLLRGKTFPEYFRAYGLEEPSWWSGAEVTERRARRRGPSGAAALLSRRRR
jgi:TupA-like ATPgrasp